MNFRLPVKWGIRKQSVGIWISAHLWQKLQNLLKITLKAVVEPVSYKGSCKLFASPRWFDSTLTPNIRCRPMVGQQPLLIRGFSSLTRNPHLLPKANLCVGRQMLLLDIACCLDYIEHSLVGRVASFRKMHHDYQTVAQR